MQLYPDQQDWVNSVNHAFTEHKCVVGQSPTGAGKTVMMAHLVESRQAQGVAVIAHRKEILAQLSLTMANFGIKHRVIGGPTKIEYIRKKHLKRFGKSFISPRSPVGVASAQGLALAKRIPKMTQQWVDNCQFAVFDEGHHYLEGNLWGNAYTMFKNLRNALILTATPRRADGIGLGLGFGGFATAMVLGPTPKQLIARGRLCQYEYYAPQTDVDFEGLDRTSTGEYSTKQQRARIQRGHLIGDVVTHFQRFAAGRQVIVFANDSESAREHEQAFKSAGIAAAFVSGADNDTYRDRSMQQFEDKQLQVLINVDLFDEGLDVKGVGGVLFGRRTGSLSKFMQICGRALRTEEGKERAIIIDPVGNYTEHGYPDDDRVWSLEGSPPADRPDPLRNCSNVVCAKPFEKFHTHCPYCETAVPKPTPSERKPLEAVDGDLELMAASALDELSTAYREANPSVEQYADWLVAQRVPSKFHRSHIKKHQALLALRDDLRAAINRWAAQFYESSKRVLDKRFYLTFGCSTYEALSRNKADTEVILQKVVDKTVTKPDSTPYY